MSIEVKPKTVRAKLHCHYKEIRPDGTGTVHLGAVYDSDPESENGRFFLATPNAQFAMHGVKAEALAVFESGKKVYVDFTAAE